MNYPLTQLLMLYQGLVNPQDLGQNLFTPQTLMVNDKIIGSETHMNILGSLGQMALKWLSDDAAF